MSEGGHSDDAEPERWADPAPTYDNVAAAYAEAFLHELDHKPLDREILTRFAATVRAKTRDGQPVCDIGCGPGHVGAFLAEQGIDTVGIDLSAGMVAQARTSYPQMSFSEGDMTALGLPDGSFTGIVCFYALIHIPRARVPATLREMSRVLAPGGPLLLAVHGGTGSLHADRMVDQPADLDVTLFSLAELAELAQAAEFVVLETHERAPYPQEHPTPRLYLWAEARS
jgi:ubiquinone/menaquinone biosynthesis C-methylase UbiE